MGATQSKPVIVDASALEAGDVILFTEKSGRLFYSVQHCKWVPYSFAAFVVRAADGNIQLCGNFPNDSLSAGEGHTVRYKSLSSELASGRYEAIYARKLVFRPTENAIKAIRTFADSIVHEYAAWLSLDEPHRAAARSSIRITHCDEEVAILMARTTEKPVSMFAMLKRSCASSPVEHFTTSRLVAEMLVEAGCLAGEGHLFTAVSSDERLLSEVMELEQPSEPKRMYSFRAVMNTKEKQPIWTS